MRLIGSYMGYGLCMCWWRGGKRTSGAVGRYRDTGYLLGEFGMLPTHLKNAAVDQLWVFCTLCTGHDSCSAMHPHMAENHSPSKTTFC